MGLTINKLQEGGPKGPWETAMLPQSVTLYVCPECEETNGPVEMAWAPTHETPGPGRRPGDTRTWPEGWYCYKCVLHLNPSLSLAEEMARRGAQ